MSDIIDANSLSRPWVLLHFPTISLDFSYYLLKDRPNIQHGFHIKKNYFIQTAHIQGKFFIELHNHSILIKVWILLQFLIKFLSDLINCCPRKFYPRARRAGSSIFLTNKITLDSSNQIILFF